MAAEPHTLAPPAGPPALASSSEAAVLLYRALVAATRNFGNHLLAMADLIEGTPFDDAAMAASDVRFGELHARMKLASAKFFAARDCTGGIQ